MWLTAATPCQATNGVALSRQPAMGEADLPALGQLLGGEPGMGALPAP